MNPFGGPPYSFPRTNGGPQAVNRGARPRRGPRRRPPRPPALVRVPLLSSQHSTFSSSSTTISRSSHVQHYTGALQPITRFSHSQDPRIPDGLATLALMDNRLIREVVLLLNDVQPDQREQVFWDVYAKLVELVRVSPPAHQIFLSRQYPRPQTGLAVYNFTNRYQQEFEEAEELGHGGFGRVVRARNKLDGHCYAIKMIITEDMGDLSPETCVQEVRTLAMLDHPQVVRYYNAWVQHEVWPQHSQWTSGTVREHSSDTSGDDSSAEESPPLAYEGGNTPSDDSVVFLDIGDGEVEAQPPSPRTQGIQQQPRQTQSHTHSQERARASGALLPYRPRPLLCLKQVLYIQMKLCGESLRKWMDDRNNSQSPVVVETKCLRIFHQMLEAMCYIHQKGYMHRDIKPANVFFTLDGGDVQLGDFGLARLITHPPNASPSATDTSLTLMTTHNYTLNVGTPLYTAPEVKRGNYDQKSDMYSLGIILLELFMLFKTDSERSSVIRRLKVAGILDTELRRHWPRIACFIERLTDKDPANRPSAKELLESALFPQPLPPPSPTTTATIEEISVGALPRLTIADTPGVVKASATAVEVICSKFTGVNALSINQVKTEKSVSNFIVRNEECLSKDEQIAVLKEENDALKRKVAALERERDLERRKNDSVSQASEN